MAVRHMWEELGPCVQMRRSGLCETFAFEMEVAISTLTRASMSSTLDLRSSVHFGWGLGVESAGCGGSRAGVQGWNKGVWVSRHVRNGLVGVGMCKDGVVID